VVGDRDSPAIDPRGDAVVRVLRRATSALVGAEDAVAAQRRACTLLAEAAPYESAWIGERDPEAGAAVARVAPEGADADPTCGSRVAIHSSRACGADAHTVATVAGPGGGLTPDRIGSDRIEWAETRRPSR
jgi:hypothetical protein